MKVIAESKCSGCRIGWAHLKRCPWCDRAFCHSCAEDHEPECRLRKLEGQVEELTGRVEGLREGLCQLRHRLAEVK